LLPSPQSFFLLLCFVEKLSERLLEGQVSEGVNFINILRAPFGPIFVCPKITKPNVTREKLLNLLSHKKCMHKMLMKLTQGWI